MKIFIFAFVVVILFSGCAPQYIVRNNYIPPANQKSRQCLNDCTYQKQQCKKQCLDDYSDCLSYAYERAKQIQIKSDVNYKKRYDRYQTKMNNYNLEIFDWQNRYDENYNDWKYFSDKCSKNSDSYACNRKNDLRYFIRKLRINKPREPREPRFVTFSEIQAKQQQKCSRKCSCDDLYDSCFIGCGGEIIPYKICVKNCD